MTTGMFPLEQYGSGCYDLFLLSKKKKKTVQNKYTTTLWSLFDNKCKIILLQYV